MRFVVRWGFACWLILLLCPGAAAKGSTVAPKPRHRSVSATSRDLRLSHLVDPLTVGDKVALGVTTAGPEAQALRQFAALAGVRPSIVMLYETWGQSLFYRSQMHPITAIGAVPMITWDPAVNGIGLPLDKVASGKYDSYIRAAAAEARRFKRRVYIRLGHEMNLHGSPWGPGHVGDSPKAFVAAWRHVVTIFRRRGARNVEWVWSPNVNCDGKCPFTKYYPGNRWVAWVGLDGYNYGPIDHDPWMSFERIFARSYSILTRLSSRPVMIAETSCVQLGGNKARWISAIGPALARRFRRVRALTWFERIKEADWRIDSSPAALAAFRRLVTLPPFDPLLG
jgi:endoglucanase